MSENPPPIRFCLDVMVLPAITGTGNETSKARLKGRFISRVTLRETTASADTFLRTNSTVGPPGLMGGTGPDNETTSIGFWSVGVPLGVEVGGGVDGVEVDGDEQPARTIISAKTAQKNGIASVSDFRLSTFIFLLRTFSLSQSGRSVNGWRLYKVHRRTKAFLAIFQLQEERLAAEDIG